MSFLKHFVETLFFFCLSSYSSLLPPSVWCDQNQEIFSSAKSWKMYLVTFIYRNKNVIMNDHVSRYINRHYTMYCQIDKNIIDKCLVTRMQNFHLWKMPVLNFWWWLFLAICTCKWNVKSKLTFQIIIKQKKILEKHFFFTKELLYVLWT